ncbi:MAG: NAD(P)-dependent oxidoreductase [Nitrosopumilus sp.]|nr:NAD(P)-dependent oxidoreductase [Nitrosopumilus sp.]MDH3501134.1 NAD(P)-dependent oxidoreductase [Nitrosopumilus sp.]
MTGHSGFIGSHFTKSFKNKFNVVGISNKIVSDSDISQIKIDIKNISIKDTPKEIFCIVHLAALTDVNYCNNFPTEAFQVNTLGTQNLLEIARKKNSKFIYLSTSHVFGNPKQIPIKENHPKQPTSIYSASKLGGEILCESYSKTYGLDISTARLFSIYGPNSPKHLVTSKIIKQLLQGNTIELGNIKPKRDFLYIDDVIKGLEILLHNTRGFNSYNIGYGKSFSIENLCKILIKIANKDIKIKSKKSLSRTKDIPNMVANCSKIKKLGWKPTVKLNDGLKLTYEWFEANILRI